MQTYYGAYLCQSTSGLPRLIRSGFCYLGMACTSQYPGTTTPQLYKSEPITSTTNLFDFLPGCLVHNPSGGRTLLGALLQGLLVDDVRGSTKPSEANIHHPTLRRVSSRLSFLNSRTYHNVRSGRHCLLSDNVGGSLEPIIRWPLLERVSSRLSFHNRRTYNNVRSGRHCVWILIAGGNTIVAEGLMNSDQPQV